MKNIRDITFHQIDVFLYNTDSEVLVDTKFNIIIRINKYDTFIALSCKTFFKGESYF